MLLRMIPISSPAPAVLICVIFLFLKHSEYISRGMLKCYATVKSIGISTQKGKLRTIHIVEHNGYDYQVEYIFKHRNESLPVMLPELDVQTQYPPWYIVNPTVALLRRPGRTKVIPSEALKNL